MNMSNKKRNLSAKSPRLKRPKLDFSDSGTGTATFNTSQNVTQTGKPNLPYRANSDTNLGKSDISAAGSSNISRRTSENDLAKNDEMRVINFRNNFSGAPFDRRNDNVSIKNAGKLDIASTSKIVPINSNNLEKSEPESTKQTKNMEVEVIDIPDDVWNDDDEDVALFEKACILADMSQAILQENKTSPNKENKDFDKLKDLIKTKEGEIQIVRSQLKQYQDSKLAENLRNTRKFDELKRNFENKMMKLGKELEVTTTKLTLQDLEVKNLRERCKQLECSGKLRYVEPHSFHINSRKTFTLSQVQKPVEKEEDVEEIEEIDKSIELPNQKIFKKLICPFIFEPTISDFVVDFYPDSCTSSEFNNKKYKWDCLPKQNVFIKDILPNISKLLQFQNFETSCSEDIINTILTQSQSILEYEQEILKFISENCLTDNEDPDQMILDNEESVSWITLSDVLNNKITTEEAAIEGRRTLGMLTTLLKVSNFTKNKIITNFDFLKCLQQILKLIVELKKPLRYTKFIISILFILQELLKNTKISDDILKIIVDIVKFIIFSRSKLNVVREIIILLQISTEHDKFMSFLCSECSDDACAMFIDSRLRSVMFFNFHSCPLFVLFTQITSLININIKNDQRIDVTNQILKWLNNVRDVSGNDNIEWLATIVSPDAKGFDLTDFLSFLLRICVDDLDLVDKSHVDTLGNGILLLKRIISIKTQQNLSDNKMLGVLCALTLLDKDLKSKLKDYDEEVNWVCEGFALHDKKFEQSSSLKTQSLINAEELVRDFAFKCSHKITN